MPSCIIREVALLNDSNLSIALPIVSSASTSLKAEQTQVRVKHKLRSVSWKSSWGNNGITTREEMNSINK